MCCSKKIIESRIFLKGGRELALIFPLCLTVPSGHGLRLMTGGDVPEVPDVNSLNHGLDGSLLLMIVPLAITFRTKVPILKGRPALDSLRTTRPTEVVSVDYPPGTDSLSWVGELEIDRPGGIPLCMTVKVGSEGPGVASTVS